MKSLFLFSSASSPLHRLDPRTKVLAVERTLMLGGAPSRRGSVSVTTICSIPELS